MRGYPTLYVEVGAEGVPAVKRVLGVPTNMDQSDWVEILFHLLSDKNRVRLLPSSVWKFECSCLFGGGLGLGDTDKEFYEIKEGNIPPMIVLDDLITLDGDTRWLLRSIYQKARRYRVFALVIK